MGFQRGPGSEGSALQGSLVPGGPEPQTGGSSSREPCLERVGDLGTRGKDRPALRPPGTCGARWPGWHPERGPQPLCLPGVFRPGWASAGRRPLHRRARALVRRGQSSLPVQSARPAGAACPCPAAAAAGQRIPQSRSSAVSWPHLLPEHPPAPQRQQRLVPGLGRAGR